MSLHRRDFLKAGLGGGLLIAVGAAAAQAELSHWVRIASDGTVTLLSNTSEIGQGTGTAIAQILADELDLDWSRVRIAMAPIEPRYFNPGRNEYGTYGSSGVGMQYDMLRKAGAQGRAVLMQAAAQRWGVEAAACDTRDGAVTHPASGLSLAYAELVQQAAQLPLPAEPSLMPRERLRYIGRDMPRLDLPAKTDGSAVFGIDVRMPGLLRAAILQCPAFGGRLHSVDPAPALAMRGVRKVVKLDDAVVVVADTWWRARSALAALKPRWDLRKASRHSTAGYAASLRRALDKDGPLHLPPNTSRKDVLARHAAKAGPRAALQRVFTVPFLAHATLEPMNGTARVDANGAELWLPTQTQSFTREAVAQALGLKLEQVTLHTTLAGGGFGRRMELDFALQAARIAAQCDGAPVQLIWSREEDMRHDYYRPAAAVKLTASVDRAGLLTALRTDTACESLFHYTGEGALRDLAKPVDPSAVGELPDYYTSVALRTHVTTVDAGVPVGFWRSVAASQNVFAYECLIDELARRARIDAFDYRRRLLAGDARSLALLDALAERARWGQALPGHHRGMAFSKANGSTIAHVVEVSVDAGKRVTIHQAWTAIDCGVAINPANVRAQVEGSMVFALSAAFFGQITLKNGAVQQSNFHDYPLVTLAQTPPCDVIVMDSREKPGGAGEEAVGGFAPALVNAIAAATGRRVYSLPLAPHGYTL